MLGRIAGRVARLAGLVLLAGFLGATLVRFAPGFDADQREFDPTLSDATRRALRQERAGERDVLGYYAGYLKRMLAGDLGTSRSLNRPVAELVAERGPVTLRLAARGLAAAWLIGLAAAIAAVALRRPWWDLAASAWGGALLAVPAALVALVFLIAGGPVWPALALIVAPRVFQYSRNVLRKSYDSPHVMAARARGVAAPSLWLRHVLPGAFPPLVALAGVSASQSVDAAIPVEVICDVPGLSHLAWQAAQGRDLPVLVTLTLLVGLLTMAANAAADLLMEALGQR